MKTTRPEVAIAIMKGTRDKSDARKSGRAEDGAKAEADATTSAAADVLRAVKANDARALGYAMRSLMRCCEDAE